MYMLLYLLKLTTPYHILSLKLCTKDFKKILPNKLQSLTKSVGLSIYLSDKNHLNVHHLKINEPELCMSTWMNLRNIILSQNKQRQWHDIYSFIYSRRLTDQGRLGK